MINLNEKLLFINFVLLAKGKRINFRNCKFRRAGFILYTNICQKIWLWSQLFLIDKIQGKKDDK